MLEFRRKIHRPDETIDLIRIGRSQYQGKIWIVVFQIESPRRIQLALFGVQIGIIDVE